MIPGHSPPSFPGEREFAVRGLTSRASDCDVGFAPTADYGFATPLTRTGRQGHSSLARRLPEAQLSIFPDAGQGGIFQYHAAFVQQALAFLE
jgi:hypothetical protein